jgi:hypothetical protein
MNPLSTASMIAIDTVSAASATPVAWRSERPARSTGHNVNR